MSRRQSVIWSVITAGVVATAVASPPAFAVDGANTCGIARAIVVRTSPRALVVRRRTNDYWVCLRSTDRAVRVAGGEFGRLGPGFGLAGRFVATVGRRRSDPSPATPAQPGANSREPAAVEAVRRRARIPDALRRVGDPGLVYGPIAVEMVRMGVRACVAGDQRPLGRSASVVVTVDERGKELAREVVPHAPGLVLRVVHFVDLNDGARVTTEAFGAMSLSVPRACTVDELREELREFIFEDELREVDAELAEEPRWEALSSALRERGVVADDQALLALPFVVELDDDVSAELDG